jgi:hypothetical protein
VYDLAQILVREILGDDAAPAVGAELNGRGRVLDNSGFLAIRQERLLVFSVC